MTTPNYDINYEDPRFTQVESEEEAALSELETTYGGMVTETDKFYKAQIDASKDWADTQTKLQNEQTDFAIEQIEQQKEQAHKDYLKEQSGAYVDWQKQSSQHGVNAEQRAAGGMQNTGYSESSQVAMYNQYQNRVATARESYNRAVLNYNNAIKDARLQNNAALAQIAYESLQKQLELSLEGFQYKNQLILDKTEKKITLKNNYYQRYQDVISQMNTENALAENVRQYNASLAEQQRQHNEDIALEREKFNWTKEQAEKDSSGGGSSSGGDSSSGEKMSKPSTKGNSGKTSMINAKTNVSRIGEEAENPDAPPIDMDSVLALGYRPISASKLSDLISEGKVKSYISGGKIKFKKVVNGGGKVGNITSRINLFE